MSMENLKVKPIYLFQVGLGVVFRYKKAFYRRVSNDMARNIDWESGDFFDINSSNQTDAVMVRADEEEWNCS